MTNYWVINLHAELPVVGLTNSAQAIPKLGKKTHIDVSNDWKSFGDKVGSGHLLLIVHGFNVKPNDGFKSISETIRLIEGSQSLNGLGIVPVIVLWPGDSWLIGLHFPAVHNRAIAAGKQLGRMLGQHLGRAGKISFLSHSLGARVVLEAARALPAGRRVDTLCVAAAAADDNIFMNVRGKPKGQYLDVQQKSNQVMVIHSNDDSILKWLYPLGDGVADLYYNDTDSPFRRALGYSGPWPRKQKPPSEHGFNRRGIGHGDYLGQGNTVVAQLFADMIANKSPPWP